MCLFAGQVHSINISFHEFLWLTDTYKYVCQLLMLLHYNPFTQFVLQERSFVYMIICHLTGSERLSEMLLLHWLFITRQNTKQFPITAIINELQVLYQHSIYMPNPIFCDHLAITDAAKPFGVFLPLWVNSLRPSDAIWRHKSGTTLVGGTKPLPEKCWLIISMD